jgi:hypothetical protein
LFKDLFEDKIISDKEVYKSITKKYRISLII